MAGRFSFSVPERRNAGDPWFRIGTLDVNTTILVIILCVASMFVWAIDDAVWDNLVLDPDAVRSGEIWRVVTWPLANQPGLWPVLTLAIFWYFGREIEGMLGRARFAVLLLLLAVVPGIVGVLLDIVDFGLAPIELAVFLIFVAEYPFVRFFFGVPGWAIGAVIVGIQVLQYLGYDEERRILLLFVTLATAALVARSMGLVTALPWIPKLPIPGTGARATRRRRPPRRSSGGGEVVAGPWSSTSRGGPARGAALPQPPGPSSLDRDQAELDALLDKISELGMDGLSSDEKRRLNDLSKRMRKR